MKMNKMAVQEYQWNRGMCKVFKCKAGLHGDNTIMLMTYDSTLRRTKVIHSNP